jgi:hypothetical protein
MMQTDILLQQHYIKSGGCVNEEENKHSDLVIAEQWKW